MSPPLVERLLAQWRDNGRRWESAAEAARARGLQAWNPGIYGIDVYADFLKKFPPKKGALLALGLNPGPYGMSQTGIPFTDCRTAARELGLPLQIPGRAPADLARRLKIPGGKWRRTYERSSIVFYRFLNLGWGGVRNAYRHLYVGNPCPLLLLDPRKWNVTPADPRLKNLEIFDQLRREALRRFHDALRPGGIICFGNDVSSLLGPVADALVGPDRVIRYGHPARAAPNGWSLGLLKQLKARGLISWKEAPPSKTPLLP